MSYRGYTPPPSVAPPPASSGYIRYQSPQGPDDYYSEYRNLQYEDEGYYGDDDEEDDWEDDIPTEEVYLSPDLVDDVIELRSRGLPVSIDTTLDNGYTPYYQVRVQGF